MLPCRVWRLTAWRRLRIYRWRLDRFYSGAYMGPNPWWCCEVVVIISKGITYIIMRELSAEMFELVKPTPKSILSGSGAKVTCNVMTFDRWERPAFLSFSQEHQVCCTEVSNALWSNRVSMKAFNKQPRILTVGIRRRGRVALLAGGMVVGCWCLRGLGLNPSGKIFIDCTRELIGASG